MAWASSHMTQCELTGEPLGRTCIAHLWASLSGGDTPVRRGGLVKHLVQPHGEEVGGPYMHMLGDHSLECSICLDCTFLRMKKQFCLHIIYTQNVNCCLSNPMVQAPRCNLSSCAMPCHAMSELRHAGQLETSVICSTKVRKTASISW